MPIDYNLQEKIDQAKEEGQEKLVLPEGQIVINQPVNIPSNFILEGFNTEILINFEDKYAFYVRGNGTNYGNAIQDVATGASTIMVDNPLGFTVGDKIAITTNKAFPYKAEFNDIVAINGNVLSLKNKILLDYKKEEEINITTYQANSKVVIKNLDIRGRVDFKTFGIFAKYTEDLIIDRVSFANIAVTPIHIESSSFPSVINCSFKSNGRAGKGDHAIGIVLCMQGQVKNNQLFESGSLYTKGSSYIVFADNTLQDVGRTNGGGINVISTFYSSILNNSVSRTRSYGIWLLNGSQHNIIADNKILSCLSSGIYLGQKLTPDTTDDPANLDSSETIEENVIANLPINFNTITRNICNNSEGGNGLFISKIANSNIISLNQACNNPGYGILIQGSNNIGTLNTATENGKNISFSGENNIVHDNIDLSKKGFLRSAIKLTCGITCVSDEEEDLAEAGANSVRFF